MEVCLASRPKTGHGSVEAYRQGVFKIRLKVGGVVYRRREDIVVR